MSLARNKKVAFILERQRQWYFVAPLAPARFKIEKCMRIMTLTMTISISLTVMSKKQRIWTKNFGAQQCGVAAVRIQRSTVQPKMETWCCEKSSGGQQQHKNKYVKQIRKLKFAENSKQLQVKFF